MTYHDCVHEVCEWMLAYTMRPNGELDKDGHLFGALSRLQRQHPQEYQDFLGDAEVRYFKTLRDRWLRTHRKANGGVIASTGKPLPGRDFVQLTLLPGIPCVRRVAMKRLHVESHIIYHERMGRAHMREAEWGRDVIVRMDAAGAFGQSDDIRPHLTADELAAWS